MHPQDILKQYFGYDSFRKGQEEIIASLCNYRDALAVMPTGSGKSICYQVPALMLPGITLVISPLISLMQDQVKALNGVGIHAAYINSSLTENQIAKALQFAERGTYKIIYVAPERLVTRRFQEFALRTEISMITVDEAHCISQWGQDFRPSYLKIVDFIHMLPKRPIVSAFTATATENVMDDVKNILELQNPTVLVTGFDRPNLYFEVDQPKKKDEFILDYLRKHPEESGIIYCATRKNVDTLVELLFKEGVKVVGYHAGMSAEDRKKNQDDFVYDRIPVIVATNAFGMGIDKSNVRFVIHYNMPQSMENYYQEAGRAGRDGETAKCILLFSAQDVIIDRMLLESKDFSSVDPQNIEEVQQNDLLRLRKMENYCKTTECLRNYILNYFGEKTAEPCGNCSNCERTFKEEDVTTEAKWIINCVSEAKSRYGIALIAGILIGSARERIKEIGASGYRSYGALKESSEGKIRQTIDQLVRQEYLISTAGKYSVLQLGPNAMNLKDENVRIIIKVRDEIQKEKSTAKKSKKSKTNLSSAGSQLFEELRQLRYELAKQEGIPPYIVFSDKTLVDMCMKKPQNKAEMMNVAGVGEVKYQRYGEQFIAVIQKFSEETTTGEEENYDL